MNSYISPADNTRTHVGILLDVWTTQAAIRYGPVIDTLGYEFAKFDFMTGTLAADTTTFTVEASDAAAGTFAAITGATTTVADAFDNDMKSGVIRLESKNRYIRVGHAGTAAAVAHEYACLVTLFNCQYTDRDNPGKCTNDTATGAVTFDALAFNVA